LFTYVCDPIWQIALSNSEMGYKNNNNNNNNNNTCIYSTIKSEDTEALDGAS